MTTEDVSPRYAALDTWPAEATAGAVLEGQLAAAAAAWSARAAIGAAAEAAVARLRGGAGRLVYAGAGASGRLGIQDGVELLPTYGWPGTRLVYLLAGGEAALTGSVEGAEDDAADAEARVGALALGPDDVVVAIAASGRTPFAAAAARAARARGALVIGCANNPASPLAGASDHALELATGPEVVAGSTRMAAGTAQKAALNALSTTIMARLGRVHDNLMVDMGARNAKLDERRVAMLRRIVPDAADTAARDALAAAGGHVKTAALIAAGLDAGAATARLEATGGNLREAFALGRSQQGRPT